MERGRILAQPPGGVKWLQGPRAVSRGHNFGEVDANGSLPRGLVTVTSPGRHRSLTAGPHHCPTGSRQERNLSHYNQVRKPSGTFPGSETLSQTILVVDDERDIVELVRYHLSQAGFRVHSASDGKQALEIAFRERPDLIVLDLMLPVLPGREVARLLRQKEATRGIPIIMLTARGEEVDRVVGFEIGADDYVVKPFSPRELVLRIQAVLRRDEKVGGEGEQPMRFGPLWIDGGSHCVRLEGKELDLTITEFKLLQRFARRPGRAFSRDQLLSEVWGYGGDVETRTVDTHVKRLRAKLGSAGDWIQTVRGVGYRFRPEGFETSD
jgi:two-component system, OmpR family, phosphate regulon response regulator PhoB